MFVEVYWLHKVKELNNKVERSSSGNTQFAPNLGERNRLNNHG